MHFISVNQLTDFVNMLTLILKNLTFWLNGNKNSLNVKKN